MAIVAKNPYKFYLRGVTKDGKFIKDDEPKDLEEDFDGLRYIRCTGIDEIGKAKNIYTETYSDADKVRTFIPNGIKNAETDIELTLCFFGKTTKDCRDICDSFTDYIRKGLHRYYDTARKKYFDFYVEDVITPSKEDYKVNIPHIEISYKLKNIYGKSFYDNDGEAIFITPK